MPKTKTMPKSEAVAQNVTLKVYRRIAIAFVLFVAIILGVVIYVSTVQATIRISPVDEAVQTDFILDIVRTPTEDAQVRGRVLTETIGRSKVFTPSGQGQKETIGQARGMVTITNETDENQALVRTTRLLTPDNTLFRIDAQVNVPAGGSVEVEAYADEDGAKGDIPAGIKMTIPGLSSSLQKVIYAESQKFSGGLTVTSVLSDQDIVRAEQELTKELEEELMTRFKEEAGDVLNGEAFSSLVIDSESSPPAGEEAAEFELSMTVKGIGVFYDADAVEDIAVRKIFDVLTQGKEFAAINSDSIQTTVEKVDEEGELANLRVYIDGRVIPSPTSSKLDPGRFSGLSEGTVRQMLINDGLAEFVEVEFFPFWVKRVPKLRDHIYIEIK